MKAEMISIRNDLLQNQSVAFLEKELTGLGIKLQKSSVIKDSPDRLADSIEQAKKQADLLILVGDLNRDENTVLTVFKHSNFVLTDNLAYILLPSPFDEMKSIYLDEMKPLLVEKLLNHPFIEMRILRLFGLSEETLMEKLGALVDEHVVIYPIKEEFEIQISVQKKNKEEAIQTADAIKNAIYEQVKEFVFAQKSQTLLETVKELLTNEGLMITAAESLTGGELLSALSSLEEASAILNGGIVTYSNDVKNENLGVTKKTIEIYGVVSAQCAIEMAEKVRKKFKVDIGVSLTGVAGPATLEGKIPGTVWIGLAKEGRETVAKKYQFGFNRKKNREQSVMTALDMVRRLVLGETIEDTVTMQTAHKKQKEEW